MKPQWIGHVSLILVYSLLVESALASPPSRAHLPLNFPSDSNTPSHTAIALQRLGISSTTHEDEVWVADLMVLYTSQAAETHAETGGIENEIAAAIHETNIAFQNSRTAVRIHLTHTELVEPEDVFDLRDSLDRLVDPADDWLDDVHALRQAKQADLVCLVISSPDDIASGIAKLMPGPPSILFGEQAFSVIRSDRLKGQYTLAHELAHNMGCQHDRLHAFDVDGEFLEGAFDFSFGHQFSSEVGSYRTVMGAGNEGVRIPYFSNPRLNFEGIPMGIDAESEESADNTLSIAQTASLVSAFRSPSVKTIPPAGSISIDEQVEFIEQLGRPVTLTASVSDEDGIVKEIDFFFDMKRVGTLGPESIVDGMATLEINHDQPGEFEVTASIRDDQGAVFIPNTVSLTIRPQGDSFADSIPLDPSWIFYSGTNRAATEEPGEPVHSTENPGQNSVWLTWIPTISGSIHLTAQGSDFLPLAYLYQGETLETLTQITSTGNGMDPNSSLASGDVLAGQIYRIAVVGLNDKTGDFQLELLYLERPSSDDFSMRIDLGTSFEQNFQSSNTGSTLEPGEPMHWNFPGGKSVWYTWTAPENGTVHITLSTLDFDPLIGIYTGNTLDTLIDLEPARTEQHTTSEGVLTLSRSVMTEVVEGTNYQIAVDGFAALAGTFEFLLRFEKAPDPPAHDLFSNAEIIEGAFLEFTASTIAATTESGEPEEHGGNPTGTSVWYLWEAPLSGEFIVTASSDAYFPIADVYTGTTINDIVNVRTQIDFPDNNVSKLTFQADQGTSYHIVVAGFLGDSGPFNFSLSPSIVPPVSIIHQPITTTPFKALTIDIKGLPGQPFEVESSSNLIDWIIDSSQRIPKDQENLIFTIPTEHSTRFFRIRLD